MAPPSAFWRNLRKYSIYCCPYCTQSEIPGLLYNGLIVISRNGQLMGTYNKTHLWAGERFWFRAGDRYPVFHMDFGTVGLMICYDGGFPEVSRILALSGAELILCPSAFPIRDKDMWDTYFGSRSLENCCFVAGINRVGTEDDCYMFGNNKIYNYRGHLLAEAPVDEEFLLVQTVDLDDVAYHRATDVPYLQDRRVETYQKLTEIRRPRQRRGSPGRCRAGRGCPPGGGGWSPTGPGWWCRWGRRGGPRCRS